MALSTKLQAAREAAGLTQQQAADRLGLAQSVICRIENGERRIDVAELMAIAKVYGKPLLWFVSE